MFPYLHTRRTWLTYYSWLFSTDRLRFPKSHSGIGLAIISRIFHTHPHTQLFTLPYRPTYSHTYLHPYPSPLCSLQIRSNTGVNLRQRLKIIRVLPTGIISGRRDLWLLCKRCKGQWPLHIIARHDSVVTEDHVTDLPSYHELVLTTRTYGQTFDQSLAKLFNYGSITVKPFFNIRLC